MYFEEKTTMTAVTKGCSLDVPNLHSPKGTCSFERLNALLCARVCLLDQKMLSVHSFFILMFRLVNTHTLLLPFLAQIFL